LPDALGGPTSDRASFCGWVDVGACGGGGSYVCGEEGRRRPCPDAVQSRSRVVAVAAVGDRKHHHGVVSQPPVPFLEGFLIFGDVCSSRYQGGYPETRFVAVRVSYRENIINPSGELSSDNFGRTRTRTQSTNSSGGENFGGGDFSRTGPPDSLPTPHPPDNFPGGDNFSGGGIKEGIPVMWGSGFFMGGHIRELLISKTGINLCNSI